MSQCVTSWTHLLSARLQSGEKSFSAFLLFYLGDFHFIFVTIKTGKLTRVIGTGRTKEWKEGFLPVKSDFKTKDRCIFMRPALKLP